MAVDGTILATELKVRMHNKFKLVMPYAGPLAQQNTSHYISMCDAIGKGLIQSSVSINFVTVDAGLAGSPLVAGTGVGLGIVIDQAWFTKKLYTELRSKFIALYGRTAHPAWCDAWMEVSTAEDHCANQPNQYNPFNFLTAMSEAISECVTEHSANYRVLNSTHPQVYSGAGQIEEGGYLGLDGAQIGTAIQMLAPQFRGSAWPNICRAIGDSYAEAIMQHSTGEVAITGTCVASQSQTCGIAGVGAGSGAAT